MLQLIVYAELNHLATIILSQQYSQKNILVRLLILKIKRQFISSYEKSADSIKSFGKITVDNLILNLLDNSCQNGEYYVVDGGRLMKDNN